ncbi:hypothetical protein JTE90_010446 [Oedothorax gibbosus]|uniref:Uncharacterized protein n=1 Tax=Oedothorax gibbosus TaxID=931172 RepID=A0AAV6VZV1_9ARAC|nr:hypothetical protein JTE90_010446 [Oedothorax gibbosus]
MVLGLAESPYNNMTACDDPYREVELYLEKAQEEIGRAVKELEEHEESVLYDEIDEKSLNDALLPPPQSFRCKDWFTKTNDNSFKVNNNKYYSLNRVCHDGNIQEFSGSLCKTNSPSPSSSFVSSFSGSIAAEVPYSPNTRRRLWRMHPSISFPETSKDLKLLGKETSVSSYEPSTNGWDKSEEDNRLASLPETRYRRRSNSDTVAPLSYHDSSEHYNSFPRPPSGDVNLLSIWADNLVLELDKSLSGELMNNSLESFSPSSDYSLSPNKHDDNLEVMNGCLDIENEDRPRSLQSNLLSLSGKNLKTVSRSSDSGIEQTSCDTPEMTEDCVDSSIAPKLDEISCNLLIKNEKEHITLNPSEFKDERQHIFIKPDRSQSTQTCRKISGSLKSAELVIENQETTENLKSLTQRPGAQLTLSETVGNPECFPLVQEVCAVNDVQTVKTNIDSNLRLECNNSINKNNAAHPESIISNCSDSTHFDTLPKTPKAVLNSSDKWSTLPKDAGKTLSSPVPLRSASQSAMNFVSIDELTDFIRKVKNGCYYPPSLDVKADKENKDAVTQTTPVPLSRSSSFTCVTECDCSDLELHKANSGSVESLELSGCSDCKVENGDFSAPSSSVDDSSEDCESPRPGSGSSSLYLSACSGSSDSFEEDTLLDDAVSSAPAALVDDVFLPSVPRSYRSSESTLRGSVLGDITEEQAMSETVSEKSNMSNPSLLDSSSFDTLTIAEESASFPSTLKMSKRNKSTGSPAQPIEPTVLVINDSKSVSAPVLLRQKRYNKPKAESSSSDSSPPSASRSTDALSGTNQVPARAHSAKELNVVLDIFKTYKVLVV